MKKYNQLIVDSEIGDCFRACMATLLQLPPEVLPNDHSPIWYFTWRKFLGQFGLELSPDETANGPIWRTSLWIATVRSLNYENGTHAILMHEGGTVFHDPSTHKRYKTGTSLLGKDIVLYGKHLEVVDTSHLHKLNDYRQNLLLSTFLKNKGFE